MVVLRVLLDQGQLFAPVDLHTFAQQCRSFMRNHPVLRRDLEGDGQHFQAVIVSPSFSGKNMIQQHRLVYEALGERMHAQIHALSMKTYTPEDWAAR